MVTLEEFKKDVKESAQNQLSDASYTKLIESGLFDRFIYNRVDSADTNAKGIIRAYNNFYPKDPLSGRY